MVVKTVSPEKEEVSKQKHSGNTSERANEKLPMQ
jgi:hypothetical protein